MSHETQMLLGLFLGIAIMIFLVMKTKTHTFIALLLAALITGLIGKMSPSDAITAIQDGFGNTLKSTGIIIGLGVMMGGILEKTGAAERMALFLHQENRKRQRGACPWYHRMAGIHPGFRRFRDRNLSHRYVRQCPA